MSFIPNYHVKEVYTNIWLLRKTQNIMSELTSHIEKSWLPDLATHAFWLMSIWPLFIKEKLSEWFSASHTVYMQLSYVYALLTGIWSNIFINCYCWDKKFNMLCREKLSKFIHLRGSQEGSGSSGYRTYLDLGSAIMCWGSMLSLLRGCNKISSLVKQWAQWQTVK